MFDMKILCFVLYTSYKEKNNGGNICWTFITLILELFRFIKQFISDLLCTL